MMSWTVLLLSTDATLIAPLADQLEGVARLETAATAGAALSQLADVGPQLFFLDARSATDGGHGIVRLLEQSAALLPATEVVLLTDAACPEPLERRAMCEAATQLRDNVTAESLADIVRRRKAAAVSVESVTHSAGRSVNSLRQFETNSPSLQRMLDDLSVAAAHDITILLIGETGSGKTYLSRLIHEASPRSALPFLHVACGALPRELIESELFGHVKGAFTSAHADKDGKFLAAAGGTILLDEIDVLGPEQQVKLLRVIETREFEPVGSNRTLRSQARLVVASNLELQPLVESGRFRPDLYYRLNMLKFEVPPLRRRRVDIVPLAKRFIARFAMQHGISVQRVDDTLYEALLRYPWPGNVRELEHVIQRSVIYCRNGQLSAEQLPAHVLAGEAGPVNDPSVRLGTMEDGDRSLEAQVAMTEKDLILSALSRNGYSRTHTARELGISRVTLYNKMKRYALLASR
ncbi:MAG: sigma-54-dependent Fis family transcriptional regulator [Planctomycetaceae bacterium]|nr:sigma-54-dependent Fis family transcriptional regulator [Planctomycetaceae bacterium]